jgi:hypothetical protein
VIAVSGSIDVQRNLKHILHGYCGCRFDCLALCGLRFDRLVLCGLRFDSLAISGSDLTGLPFLACKSARLILLRFLRRAPLDSSGSLLDFPMVARDADFLARRCVDEESRGDGTRELHRASGGSNGGGKQRRRGYANLFWQQKRSEVK